MPKKTDAKPQNSYQQTFVQCELDKSTKDQVRNWDPKYTQTIDGLDRMVNDGYKVSIARDKYHDCVGVFCTMPEQGHPHQGFCLTGRGPGLLDALKVLVFKHFTVLDGNWQTENAQRGERDAWG